ncbi:UDP-N-acetylmuramate dehydrogenase [Blastopirellula sp. J2-11]|uniref:UDP-N-acetylmuramate dehydrogenase n=1 Tax=Blastopirellula sp. J2-11 TaxID=2943192 RepID=UPI0021CAC025|nr:UDP-N-acetylmuramate dehydrogenase [Blastopirellula sp. J2-11]UUO04448.1 UDP-N-acetylmuramate dehydrogenase [Blastopirellula sp. J2-11]
MDFCQGFEHFVRTQEPLASYAWLRIGGAAEYFAEPNNVTELAALLKRCREQDKPVRLLGGGSNLLIRDEALTGVVVRLSHPSFSSIDVNDAVVQCGGGARLANVVSTTVGLGLAGLESLVGIPGTIGGALRGNAGNNGEDVGRWATTIDVMTAEGEIRKCGAGELRFSYRESNLDEFVILGAALKLEKGDAAELTRRMQKQWIVKRAAEPLPEQNISILFRNPADVSAASLIEQAGLRDASVGAVRLSDRNANFVVAAAGAKATDVLQLMELVRSRVHEVFGIELKNGVTIW